MQMPSFLKPMKVLIKEQEIELSIRHAKKLARELGVKKYTPEELIFAFNTALKNLRRSEPENADVFLNALKKEFPKEVADGLK